jgi:hypothetical protein
MIIWIAIGLGTLACYLAKLAGLSLPKWWLPRQLRS